MKIRLINCTGYYSLINIITSLQIIEKEDSEEYNKYKSILLLTYNGLNENDFKNIINLISDNIFKFDEVYYLSKEEIEKKNFNTLYRIRENFPIIDEFWDDGYFYLRHVCRECNHKYEYFVNYIKLIVYDEGIGSYLHLFNNEIIVGNIYYLFPEILSPMDKLKYTIKEINLEIYKQNIKQISQLLNVKKEHIEEKAILFISSLFWEEEIENIKIIHEAELINTLINDYDYHIYYKSHPRSGCNEINQVLERIINKDKFHIIEFEYNIEIYLANHKFNAVLSYYSTVLFSAFKVFRIPTFTYTDRDLIKDRESSFLQKTLINLYIPNIKDYFNNRNNYTLEQYYNSFQKNVQQQLTYTSFFEIIKEKQELFTIKEKVNFLGAQQQKQQQEQQQKQQEFLEQINQLQDNFTGYKNTRLAKRLQKVGINILVAFIGNRALRMEARKKLLQKIYVK